MANHEAECQLGPEWTDTMAARRSCRTAGVDSASKSETVSRHAAQVLLDSIPITRNRMDPPQLCSFTALTGSTPADVAAHERPMMLDSSDGSLTPR